MACKECKEQYMKGLKAKKYAFEELYKTKTELELYLHNAKQELAEVKSQLEDVHMMLDEDGQKIKIGDGWLRLMTFDLGAAEPSIVVRTYSAHYEIYSTDIPMETYAGWYKEVDGHADWSEEQLVAADDFVILLEDFRPRFGAPEFD